MNNIYCPFSRASIMHRVRQYWNLGHNDHSNIDKTSLIILHDSVPAIKEPLNALSSAWYPHYGKVVYITATSTSR